MTSSTSSPWQYRENTSDFGVSVKSLLIPRPLPSGQGRFVHTNLSSLGKELGIETVTSKLFYYPRDTKTRTPSGTVLGSTCVDTETQKLASDRCWKREKHLLGNCAATATEHPCFANMVQGQGIEKQLHLMGPDGLIFDEGNKSSPAYKPSRGYLEGGNILVASNREGKIKVLIGADTTTLTHQILRKTKFFHPPAETAVKSSFSDRVTTLYESGEVPKMVEELAPSLSEKEVVATGREMHAMGLLTDFDPKATKASAKLTKIVKEYLGQKEFIRQVLWPAEFGVNPEDIVEVPQAAYHLDVFIKTAPKGALFVQDFPKTFALLEGILDAHLGFDGESAAEQIALLQHSMRTTDPKETLAKLMNRSKGPALTDRDLSILQSYLETTTQLIVDFQSLYERVNVCLRKAGFTVIGAPGTFYGAEGKNWANLNFLNAISGWSEKKQSYYYICLGAKVGDRLGMELMQAYYKFLQSHQTPLLVYFVGYDPANPSDFSDAMSFSSERGAQAGIHCLTYELETEKHSDKKT